MNTIARRLPNLILAHPTLCRRNTQTMATTADIAGSYAYTNLQIVYYGPSSVKTKLPKLLDKFNVNKAMILTGNSLKNKTDIISNIEKLLGDKHAITFAGIDQHAPVESIYKALETYEKGGADVIIAIGGGSVIDSSKVISQFYNEKYGSYIKAIAIPTTLSAAEYTSVAGFTKDGNKTGVRGLDLVPAAVILDGEITLSTPPKLWLGTGMRALDHAVECLVRPYVPPPIKTLAYAAIVDLFKYLKACKKDPQDVEIRQLLLIAAWHSLFPYTQEPGAQSALGLSHSLGYFLGSPHSIPHGECSALTLGSVVLFKATHASEKDKQNLAKVLPFLGKKETGDATNDVKELAKEIERLVKDLDLDVKLSDYGVDESELAKITRAAGLKDEDQREMIEILKASKL